MNSATLLGLMLLNSAGAFCIGLAAGRLLFRSPKPKEPRAASAPPPAGVLLTAEEVVRDVELALSRDGQDLDAALADLSSAGATAALPDRLARLARLRETARLSQERLERDHGRLARLAGPLPPDLPGLADEVGAHRDRVGALRDRLEGDAPGQAVTEVLTELADNNRRLRTELEETRAKLESREAQLAEAQREARVDPLTKLANRRSFEERLAGCQARLDRGHERYAVALFDLDRFKALNDKHGHPAGDAVLAVFAKILKDSARAYDLPARHGGEEFAVLLPGTDAAGASAFANRCRARTEQALVRHGGDQIAFTISGGVAAGRPGRPAAETLARADQALYAAKSAGRNRIVSEDPLPSDELGAHPAA